MRTDRASASAETKATKGLTAPLTGFRLDVQALRGLAVLLVVLYHARVIVPGGFVGVDIFFVISGFVIGRGIVAQLSHSGAVEFRTFYLRRARRLLPALSVMLVFVVLCAPLLAPVASIAVTFRTAIAAALFNANGYLYFASSTGYFEPSAELNPLLHTWSLSVEEQFYFVIPALLFAGWRIGWRRVGGINSFRIAVGALFVISLGACVLASFTESTGPLDGLRFAFFSPLTRTWEFAAGLALVALPCGWFPRTSGRVLAAVSGAALIAIAAFMFDDATVFPGVAALVPVTGASLVILAGTHARLDGTDRASRALVPLKQLGDVSYSWYLWHWPMIVFAGAFWPASGRTPLVAAAALSLAPAWISFRWIEQRLTRTAQRKVWPTVALASACILAPIATALAAPTVNAHVSALAGPAELKAARQTHLDNRRDCDSKRPISERSAEDRSNCTFGEVDARSSVVLFGDSNAGQLSDALAASTAATDSRVEIVTMSACPVAALVDSSLNPACESFLSASIEAIAATPPDVVVVAFSTNTYMRDSEKGTASGLRRLVSALENAGTDVAIVSTLPKPGVDMDDWSLGQCSNLSAIVAPAACAPPPFQRNRADLAAARALEASVASTTGAEIWSFEQSICPSMTCSVSDSISQRSTWRDANHIGVAASIQLTAEVTSALQAMVRI